MKRLFIIFVVLQMHIKQFCNYFAGMLVFLHFEYAQDELNLINEETLMPRNYNAYFINLINKSF